VLQSKKISRVGGEKPINVNVRIIAATNRDLKQMVSENKFREDLWFRLNIFPITVPALRHRKEDIPALIRYFVTQKSRELNIAQPPAIAPSTYNHLMSYNWPGNVRELENTVERELIRYQGGQLRFDCLRLEEQCRETVVPTQSVPPDGPLNLDEAMCLHISKVLKMTKGKIYGPGGAAELLDINSSTLRGRMRTLGIHPERQKS
jgi:hydrogenase-4 transcriptional activator